jgi:hypothetical protein
MSATKYANPNFSASQTVALRLQRKTSELIEQAREILEASLTAMTVRQCFYQLVVRQFIENSKSSYRRLVHALAEGRKQGLIRWDRIEDRLRRPRRVSMWDDVPDFADTVVRAYRRNLRAAQSTYLHVWLEKDALSGMFEDELDAYGVTLNVGRGYDGWSSIYEAAMWFRKVQKPIKILYFGDFDPSGEHMPHSLEERLGFFGVEADIQRVAILKEDIKLYNLPPDFAKPSDTRSASFVSRYGDQAVELDALPPDVLRDRLIEAVERNLDLEQLSRIRELEERERQRVARALRRIRVGAVNEHS